MNAVAFGFEIALFDEHGELDFRGYRRATCDRWEFDGEAVRNSDTISFENPSGEDACATHLGIVRDGRVLRKARLWTPVKFDDKTSAEVAPGRFTIVFMPEDGEV